MRERERERVENKKNKKTFSSATNKIVSSIFSLQYFFQLVVPLCSTKSSDDA